MMVNNMLTVNDVTKYNHKTNKRIITKTLYIGNVFYSSKGIEISNIRYEKLSELIREGKLTI